MKPIILLSLCLASMSANATEAITESRTISLETKNLGIEISPTFSGIFFEDINNSLDGGICAQLIQNFSFQQYMVPDAPAKEFSQADSIIFGWSTINKGGAKGKVTTVSEKPLLTDMPRYYDFDTNDKYNDELRYIQYCVKFDIKEAGEGFGLAANGYGISEYGNERAGYYYSNNTQIPSIAVNKGVSYDLSLYLQGAAYDGKVSIYLEDANGRVNSEVYVIDKLKDDWTKYTTTLKAERTADSRLAIVADKAGIFYMDFVTLMPEASELWMDGKAGPFRKDLMQALADL
ncbi:MAG: alpha-L-arabinofuranosidase, partial [Bacteroidaceae bacterium]|nr:alpha-L-arabinofuranosidase [Bacteroidaceae bacterium]